MDDKVTLRLDGSPRMTARGILDHPDITEFARAEHLVPQAFRVALLEPITLATMSLGPARLAAADTACADVVRISIDNLVLSHPDPPPGLARLRSCWCRVGCAACAAPSGVGRQRSTAPDASGTRQSRFVVCRAGQKFVCVCR